MSIHDEFEQSLGAKSGGMKTWTKVLLGLAVMGVLMFSAVAVAGIFVAREVRSTVEEFKNDPALTIAERVVRRSQDLELISTDQAAQTVTFRTRGDSEVRTVDVKQILEGSLRIHTDEGTIQLDLEGGQDGGALVIRKADGEVVRIDATGGDGAATLTVETDEGEVLRIDARGDDDSGSLVIRTEDDVLRFDARGDDDSGTFSIRSSDGELVRFDVEGSGDDATLTVHTQEGATTFTGLREGGHVPSWVPDAPARARDRSVYTAESDEARAGATEFDLRESVGDVLDHYREALEDEGYSVKVQNLTVDDRNLQGTIVAESADRTVLIMAAGVGNTSKVFLAFSERD